MVEGQAYELKDSRDNTTYNVAKLADGRVWLLDNLALDLTDSTVKASLSSTNTNASDTTLGYLKNGGGTASDQYAMTGVADWTDNYSFSTPLINTASKDVVPTSGYQGKVGVYYNYCAASAGSYCYGNGASLVAGSGNATEDICPKGWRLPTGGSAGEYKALYVAYNSAKDDLINALHVPFSGYFFLGSASYQGSSGLYWSSTWGNPANMYYMYAGASEVDPQDHNNRYNGYAVRCIAQ